MLINYMKHRVTDNKFAVVVDKKQRAAPPVNSPPVFFVSSPQLICIPRRPPLGPTPAPCLAVADLTASRDGCRAE